MRVRVKICGLTDEHAVETAAHAGADALGFVLAPSPRRVSLARAAELLARVPEGIERVLVLGRASRSALLAALALAPDAVQAELDSDWPDLATHVFALPALRDGPDLVARAAALGPAPTPAARGLCGACVLDGPRGGGRGIPVDVKRARRLAAARPLLLAGGLTPETVAARIQAVRPFGVDVSSGVERAPGVKDCARIHAFVRAVRALDATRRSSSEALR
jgi:phosphoribosylanthranilate isomerase